jgi:ubiquinone/menaquinone biosynthesis C-methylase UbiE
MNSNEIFSFGDSSVAAAYDNYLVPVLFEPWAQQLITDHKPWLGKSVLDLATGTGVVAKLLAQEVGAEGSIIAADFNSQMLDVARRKCDNESVAMTFLECAAEDLNIDDTEIDVVVCQQGFQFFPDKIKAAKEIYRVLGNGGKAIIATWRPVLECEFFGAICFSLESMGELEISQTMRMPFDMMPQEELVKSFRTARFSEVEVSVQSKNMVIPEGTALDLVYSTPIGPMLSAMNANQQRQFKELLNEIVAKISPDNMNMGKMVSNMLVAYK